MASITPLLEGEEAESGYRAEERMAALDRAILETQRSLEKPKSQIYRAVFLSLLVLDLLIMVVLVLVLEFGRTGSLTWLVAELDPKDASASSDHDILSYDLYYSLFDVQVRCVSSARKRGGGGRGAHHSALAPLLLFLPAPLSPNDYTYTLSSACKRDSYS